VTVTAGRLAGIIALVVLSAAAAQAAGSLRPVDLVTRPIERLLPTQDDTRFGQLEFRGGLELGAADWEFGSLSGLDFTPLLVMTKSFPQTGALKGAGHTTGPRTELMVFGASLIHNWTSRHFHKHERV
jgi:hypothetical protein